MWQTLGGHCIYQSASNIYVYQNPIYRWLRFDSQAIQTLLHRYNPSKPSLKYIRPLTLLTRRKPGDCCILGLGGAGVLHALAPFIIQHEIIAVEESDEVIKIAKQFFYCDKITNLTIIHQDAYDFVSKNNKQFAYLMIDLSDAYAFPKSCHSIAFFMSCRDALAENGILAINLANQDVHRSVFKFLQHVFTSKTIIIPIPNTANIVILAVNHPDKNHLLNLMQQSSEVKQLFWRPEWGYMAEI